MDKIDRYLNFRNKFLLIVDVIIWLLGSLVLLYLGELFNRNFSIRFPYFVVAPEAIRVAIFFLCLVVVFVLSKELPKSIKSYFQRNKRYIFNSKNWPKEWIFNGKTELTIEGYLFVKSSRAGNLLKDYYWKNLSMSFEMRFLNEKDKKILGYQKRIGIVFRAEDLNNYFMIEIGKDVEDSLDLSIKPHIRYGGGWELMSVEEIKAPFNFSDFVKIKLEVEGDTAHLFYEGVPVFDWVLPTHVDVNHIESGVNQDEEKSGKTDRNMVAGKSFAGHVQGIPFRLKYGLVGFRAYMKHGAIIRNLKIEPL